MAATITRIPFTNRDFASAFAQLQQVVQQTNPTLWSDLFDSNLGTLLMQQFALVVDLLSQGQDATANEIFLSTARRYESGLRFAASVGYVPRSATAAAVTVRSIQLPDAVVLNGGVILAGTVITGANGLPYELQEEVTILPGASVSRLALLEGVSYTDTYAASTQPSQVVTTSNYVVQDSSWVVKVGNTIWKQVANVSFENGPTNTYEVFFDGLGRLNVEFGDGIAGAIPNAAISIAYRTTDGLAGNCPVGSIAGSVTVSVGTTYPGVLGTASVQYQNQDVDVSASGGTQLNSNESQGSTIVSTVQSGTLGKIPISSGSLILTVNLTGGGGTLQLQDNADGTLRVVNNTISPPVTLVSSSINYTTGVWNFHVSSALTAGGPISATYYSVVSTTGSTVFIGAATGGDNRESLDELRVNIPAYIRSNNKIITLQDYDDVLLKLPGIALVLATKFVSSYSANMVKLNVWSQEQVTFNSESPDGSFASAAYDRYVEVQQDQVSTIQGFLNDKTILALHNVIVRPTMLWCDIYLGDVIYDGANSEASVEASIVAAVVKVFEKASGFDVPIADIYNAVRTSLGVETFNIERIATGSQQTSDEVLAQTTGTATVSGTFQFPTLTPGSVVVTIEQTTGTQVVIKDDKMGGWTLVSAPSAMTILSGSVNYLTGAFTVTFSVSLIANQQVLGSYANVLKDYRRAQNVTFNAGTSADAWPPPGVPTTIPVTTPPYFDGVPLSATRLVGGVITPVPSGGAPLPYQAGDVLTYDKIQDITTSPTGTNLAYYDDQYQYNDEIYYNSVIGLDSAVEAINLRRLIFNLVPASP